jgi:hypothetical protein
MPHTVSWVPNLSPVAQLASTRIQMPSLVALNVLDKMCHYLFHLPTLNVSFTMSVLMHIF